MKDILVNTFYNKDVAESVISIVSNYIDCEVSSYGESFLDDAKESFAYFSYSKELDPLYTRLADSRSRLSEGKFDLTDASVQERAFEFLGSISKLLSFYADKNTHAADINILKKIEEADIQRTTSNEVLVGVGNPLLLERLLTSRMLLSDLDASSLEETPEMMYRECLKHEIDNLVRNIDIVYENEVYRINGFDNNQKKFVAVKENKYKNEEFISALNLYGDIRDAAEDKEGTLRVLIVGETIPGSIDLLRDTLKDLDVGVSTADKSFYINGQLKRSALDASFASYDMVYILDCFDMYSHTISTKHSDCYLYASCHNSLSFNVLEAYLEREEDLFEESYYSVMHHFSLMPSPSSRGRGSVDSTFFEYLENAAQKYPHTTICVYGVEGIDAWDIAGKKFNNDTNASNVYPSADTYGNYSIYKIGKDTGITGAPKESIEITYFDILSALSSSDKFYRVMTCIEDEEDTIKAIKRAYDTHIKITYDMKDSVGSFSWGGLKRACDVDIEIECEDDEEYRKKVEQVINEVMSPCKEFREASRCMDCMSGVLYERSHSFTNILFHHIYSGKDEEEIETDFILKGIKFTSFTKSESTPATNTTSYNKYAADWYMGNLDGDRYSETSVVWQTSLAGSAEKRKLYGREIKNACKVLNYEKSALYGRIGRYF